MVAHNIIIWRSREHPPSLAHSPNKLTNICPLVIFGGKEDREGRGGAGFHDLVNDKYRASYSGVNLDTTHY